jgi:hypothetical protein
VMDTQDMSFTQPESVPEAGPIPSTHLADVIRSDYSG